MPDNPALDSRAVLGLLAKAHQIFAGEGTELSFPLGSPVSFDSAALTAAMGPGPDAAGHALLAEFSTMMNWVPDGVVWPPVELRTLDEIVRYVVEQATWAAGTRTPEEEARATAARAMIDLANPVMQDYAAHKDAWIRSREQVRNNPDDLMAQEAEHQARAAFLTCPGREDIEIAMDDLVALDDRAPYRTREEMQRQIDVGTGTFDDPTGGRFAPVRPLPREVIEAPNWDSVTLDRAALDELASSAPQVLTDHLRVDSSENDPIVAISFEYASAQLHRQWLDDRLFELRCWRFDDGRVLADGQTPAHGDCTSYVRAIVLARNVAVTTTVPPGVPATAAPGSIGFMVAESTQATKWDEVLTRAKAWDDPKYLVAGDRVEMVHTPETHVRERIQLERPVQPTTEAHLEVGVSPHEVVRFNLGEASLARPSVIGRPTPPRDFIEPRVSGQLVRETVAVRNFDYIFEPVEAPTPPVPVAPRTATVTTAPGQVILLALICKTLGKSPDPDGSYDWAA
jgi:hypothetical protein